MRFVSRYFRIFRLVLEASADERAWPDWPSVARELARLMEEERGFPLPPGFAPAARREALWPVLAWTDETLLTSRRRDAARWYDHSLQRSLLDTNRGGELFYRRLRNLLLTRRESLSGGRAGGFEAASGPDGARGGGPGRAPAGDALPADPFGLSGVRDPYPPDEAEDGPGFPDVADYLPGRFQAEEAAAGGRDDGVSAAGLAALWERPGEGPEPLESVLDVYAMCIVLGFKGQFSPRARAREAPAGGGAVPSGDPAGAAAGPASPDGPEPGGPPGGEPDAEAGREALKAAARLQMSSWCAKGARTPLARDRRGLLARLADFWRDYDWVFYHVVIPLLAVLAFYFHGAAIIENLPF